MMKCLTGRRRYRVDGLFRKRLVLQVEYTATVWDGGYDFELRKYWRDAMVEDLMIIEAEHRPHPIGAT